MVDALHEAGRVLRPRGTLIDARPDSRVLAKVEHAGRIVGTLRTQAPERRDDLAADHAVGRVKRERAFRRVRAGRLWHRVPFASLGAFEQYVREHLRFAHQVDWRAEARGRRRRWAQDEFVLIRAIRFELLERAR